MNNKTKSFRSALGRVRALGSAHSGTHHWLMQRFTAVILLALALYPLFGFFVYAVYGGRTGAIAWLHSPLAAMGVVLFLIVGFRHSADGLQVVIEDYVHCPCAKMATVWAVKIGALAFALLGILATLKIFFGA